MFYQTNDSRVGLVPVSCPLRAVKNKMTVQGDSVAFAMGKSHTRSAQASRKSLV